MGQRSEELRADIEQRRQDMGETIDAIEGRVSPSRIAQRRVDRAKSWAGGVRERVMGSADTSASLTDRATGGVDQVKQTAQHLGESVGDAPAALAQTTRGNPLVAGAIAFGLGALVASLLPETEPERQAVESVQPQLQAATDAVREAGQHTLETTKTSAQDAVAELKDSASDHVEQIKDEATDAADQVKQQATATDDPAGS
jgi:hypothetical protein